MNSSVDMIYDIKRKMLTKYPRFGSEIAVANIEFRDDLPFYTAATDGKNIYVDPEYFESLSENDRLFIIAHEIMHIKFMHMYRLADKDGKKRDPELWNIATDAIINANLERDGFTIKEGYVNMPEALNYSAEEFYEILLREKEEKEKQQQQNGQGNQGDSGERSENSEGKDSSQNDMGEQGEQKGKQSDKQGQDENQNNGDGEGKDKEEGEEEGKGENGKPSHQGDDHSLWEEAFKNQQQQGQKQKGSSQKQQSDGTKQRTITQEQPQADFDERSEFEDNRQEKRERFKARREKTQQDIRGIQEGVIKFGNIGESKETIDWKVLLRREEEKTETIWSQRRSIAENNYAYRLEENDIEDEAETEILLDTSDSVSETLLKNFLRECKNILANSKVKVGCFNTKFYGFTELRRVEDIDNMSFQIGGGTDFNAAVEAFSRRVHNKIIFTDGKASMPEKEVRNVIWVVFGNERINPKGGKVINITGEQLRKLYRFMQEDKSENLSR